MLCHRSWTSAQLRGQRTHALGLCGVAAQLFLEGDLLQQGSALGQRSPLIELIEEARIVEAGPQHALIPMPDGVFRVGIGSVFSTARKCGDSLCAASSTAKVVLVIAHDGHQHFFR